MKALRPAGSWACAAWLAVQAATAGAAPSLRYAKPIATPPRDKEELVAVTLDGDVFAATREGFPDVRILDDAGAETAFVLRPASERRTTKVRQTWSAANPRIKLLDDDGLEITVELAERDPTPLGLRLKTPLVNFEQRVRVFASVDGDEWQPVLEEGVIFDYSQFMDVRNDSLELTPPAIDAGAAPPRHYRIVIDDVTKEQQSQLMELTRRLRGEDETGRSERVAIVRQPFRIDEIEFWSDVEKQEVAGPRQAEYSVKAEPAEHDERSQQTIVRLTTRNEPLTALRLATATRNFSRPVRVEVWADGAGEPTWRPLGSATVSRLDFRDLQREQLEVTFPETRATAYRLVIENRDSPPLDVTGVEARGTAYEAVFLARPTATYRLAYRSPSIRAPNYDTTAVAAALAADYRPMVGALGEAAHLSPEEPEPGAPLAARLLNSPVFLTAAVGVLVVVLGVGLYRAARRLDNLPP